MNYNSLDFSVLKGKILTQVYGAKGDETIGFHTSDGKTYSLYHNQDCCESVRVEDIEGDWNDLIGLPLLVAEETSNLDNFVDTVQHYESFTWTFYRLATMKGWVIIRWLGESNGYYSEEVSFRENS